MALNYDNVTALTKKFYIPRIVDNVFTASPVLAKMWKGKDSIDGGTKIHVPVEYAENTSKGWFEGRDTFTTTDVEIATAAEYSYFNAYCTISIDGDEERQNNSDKAIVKLLDVKMRNAEKSLRKQLGTALYNDGTTAKAWDGLRFLTGDTSTTAVGGIDQDDMATWIAYRNSTAYAQADLDDPSSASYILKIIQTLIRNTTFDGVKPTMIAMTERVFDILELVLEGTKERSDVDLAKVGFESILYRNVILVPDSYCYSSGAAGVDHMYAIHEDYTMVKVHNEANFNQLGWVRPYNSEARFNQIIVSGNFISSQLRTLGVVSNISFA
jgi:hypothetical protein